MSGHRWRAWMVLFLFALALRAGVAAWRPPPLDGDQRLYLHLAESMARGDGYVQDGAPKTSVHPLLPSVHAALIVTGAGPRAAGMALTVAIGAILPLVAGLTVASILGRTYGLSAGSLLAVQPHFVLKSASLEPDLLGATLGFWVASALWRRREMLAGALLGLAYLNRPEAIFLFPPAAWIAWRRGARAAALVRMTVPVIALAAVFVLFVHAAEGRWALSGKDHWQYMLGVHQYRSGNRPVAPETVQVLREELPSIAVHLRSSPREAILGYGYRWGLLVRAFVRLWLVVLMPVAFVGIVHAWRRERDGLLILCLPLFVLPVYPVVGVFFRHAIVPGPLLVALSAVGIVALVRARSARTAHSTR